jgi:hypothetical protein
MARSGMARSGWRAVGMARSGPCQQLLRRATAHPRCFRDTHELPWRPQSGSVPPLPRSRCVPRRTAALPFVATCCRAPAAAAIRQFSLPRLSPIRRCRRGRAFLRDHRGVLPLSPAVIPTLPPALLASCPACPAIRTIDRSRPGSRSAGFDSVRLPVSSPAYRSPFLLHLPTTPSFTMAREGFGCSVVERLSPSVPGRRAGRFRLTNGARCFLPVPGMITLSSDLRPEPRDEASLPASAIRLPTTDHWRVVRSGRLPRHRPS